MSKCKTCKTVECGCGSGATAVQPPLSTNTPSCPNPEPCENAMGTECIIYTGDNKTCGEDTVYETGDTIEEVQEKIVDYFCEQVEEATIIVTQKECGEEDTVYETGDTIIEALEKTVDYFCGEVGGIVAELSNKTSKYAAEHIFVMNVPLTIPHSLGSADIIIQVKDSTGELVTPSVVSNYTTTDVSIEVSVSGTYRVIAIG